MAYNLICMKESREYLTDFIAQNEKFEYIMLFSSEDSQSLGDL